MIYKINDTVIWNRNDIQNKWYGDMTRITFHVVRDTFHEMLFISWYISRNTGKGYSVRLHQADTVGYATVSDWGCAPKLSKGAQVVVSPNARLPGSPARGTSSNASGTFNTFNKGTIHALPLVLTAFWGNWDAIIVILLHGCSAGDGASASCALCNSFRDTSYR
jgi:hypothetical protein